MTQRELLKWTSSIFDPLGLTGPLTIRLRQTLQETRKQHLSWDTKLGMSRLPDLPSWIKETEISDTSDPSTLLQRQFTRGSGASYLQRRIRKSYRQRSLFSHHQQRPICSNSLHHW